MRIEGKIIVRRRPSIRTATERASQGFDEFMNLVVDDAAEVFVKDAKPRRELGQYLSNPCLRSLTQ